MEEPREFVSVSGGPFQQVRPGEPERILEHCVGRVLGKNEDNQEERKPNPTTQNKVGSQKVKHSGSPASNPDHDSLELEPGYVSQ